ncbi:MAG: hypothetical protein JW863_24125 [Chitinispirillaceae bacterium]|nr:hypothetical protein [Chitinispirillaceae bacterium]
MAKTPAKLLFLFLLFPLWITATQLDKIAVLNLKNTEGVTQGEAELLTDRLRNDLFSTGKVEVMERDQMQNILAEQGLQQSGITCTDEGCMVEFGKLLGVKILVSGSIGKLGSLFMINAKSIDVQTAQILKVVSEDVKGEIEDVVEILPTVAAKLTGASVATAPPSTAKPATEPVAAPRKESTSSLPCDGSIFVEKMRFPRNIISFNVPADDADDIDEDLAEAVSQALERSVISASNARIVVSTCKTFVVRFVVTRYEVRPAAMKQFTGTLYTDVSIFASPQSKSPIATVKFKNTGDRHWGDITPLQNAIEQLAESIEDDLYSTAKKALKQAGFKR